MAPLTLEQARKVLSATTGWADIDGFIRVYEAMLRTNGWADEAVRGAEVDRVRRLFAAAPIAPRLQVLSALDRPGNDGFTAREIAAHCRPIGSGQVAIAIDDLTQDGRIEEVEPPGRRWRKVNTARMAKIARPLVPPLLHTAQRVWHAWGTGDVETVVDSCRVDVVVRPSPPLPTLSGHDGLRSYQADLAARGILCGTVQQWTQQGEDVVIRSLLRIATPAGDEERDALFLYRFRGEKIALIQMM